MRGGHPFGIRIISHFHLLGDYRFDDQFQGNRALSPEPFAQGKISIAA